VLEGSVQRTANRLKVSAQLIDARTDAHLWAQTYERDPADIFAIQTEIAQQIANQLQAKLSPAEKAAIAERPTEDPVAYALYTKANAIEVGSNWEGVDKEANQKVQLLEKATQRDPNFALAYGELANAQNILYLTTGDPEHLELAKKAAETAVRLRPDLGETHLALASYYFSAASFDRAREELAIARLKLPNNADAIFITGRIDRRQNRWDSALANFQKANELDPRAVWFAEYLGGTYLELRRYEELEQFMKKCATNGTLESSWTQHWIAQVKLAQGDPGAAQSVLEQVPLDFSPHPFIWQTRFDAALYLRDYEAVSRVIAATPAKWATRGIFGSGQPPESLADGQVALARGDKEKALAVFAAGRKKLDATWGDKPKDEGYYRQAAVLDAALGRKEDAIREALHAVELMPIAKDSINGPALVIDLALVYAWTGERDRALEQLEIVATIPNGPTYGDLRFNPYWDDLRGDPRFEKIVAAAKAASR
jgi:tetratricopeptide (TPR) repeat protein